MSERLRIIRAFWRTVHGYLTWGDQALILLVLAAVMALVPLLSGSAQANGRWALVRLEGKIIQTLSLSKDQALTVSGPLGETVIEVQQGRVRVVRSPGPQQICVRQGWMQKPGETLICLPNRVTIEIPGNSGIDGVTR